MKSLVNRVFKLFILTMFILGASVFYIDTAYSQENSCLSKLKKAQELFDSGLIEEIPFMLDSCLKDGFNKEQVLQAYRLLIQVYLFDYNQEKAEKTMLELLSNFPEYTIHANDPVEFVNLFNQFQTKPKFSFSINSGLNLSDVTVIENYSTGNLNNLKSTYRTGGIKAGFRLSFEKYLSAKTWITLGVGYSFAGYEVEEKMNFDRELLTFSEKMQYVNVPLYFNYSFKKSGKITPYVFLGGQYSYLLKSEGEINRRGLGENAASYDLSGVATDIANTRYRNTFSALGGIGMRFKISSGYLRANLYYTRGINSYVKDDNRFSNHENLFHYNYIDDDIKLNFFNFTLGYSYIFYKTTKKAITN